MGTNNHPTVNVDENSEGETYSRSEAIAFIDDATEDWEVTICREFGRLDEIVVKWEGNNRIDVFKHLLQHGWAVTSVHSQGKIYFENVADQL